MLKGYSSGKREALCFAPIDPIEALYWSAVINGVISVPIMAVLMLMAARTDVMGRFVVTRRLKWLGWMATAVMAAAVAAMFATLAGASRFGRQPSAASSN